jgi:signal transduction histidine kinase
VKLRTAFLLSLLAVLVVMAVPAVFGVRQINEVRRIALDLREQAALAALAVGRVQAATERLDRFERAYVATLDPELEERAREAVHQALVGLDQLRAAGYGAAVDRSGFPVESLSEAVARTGSYVRQGRLEEATRHLSGTVAPLLADAGDAVDRLAEAIDRQTADEVARADAITAGAAGTVGFSFLVALAVSAFLMLLAARVLTRPLERLGGAMAAVADGDFVPPDDLPYERPDELGDLLRGFRSMALRLADLDRVKAEFVGMASHDLKTPINVITGYTELLEEEVAPSLEDRHREILEAVSHLARTLGRRVNQLMEISRLEASGLRLGLEEINLRHFASAVERRYQSRAATHEIRFETRVDDSAPSFLIGDPDVLHREVVDNLLSNALRFTPKGGRISLVIGGYGGLVSFELSDTGAAIDPDDLPFVFDRYYQGRGLPGRVGAGLGLPIAAVGVQAHGGTITVESSPPRGTTFRFSLPIHPTAGLAAAPEPARAPNAGSDGDGERDAPRT